MCDIGWTLLYALKFHEIVIVSGLVLLLYKHWQNNGHTTSMLMPILIDSSELLVVRKMHNNNLIYSLGFAGGTGW